MHARRYTVAAAATAAALTLTAPSLASPAWSFHDGAMGDPTYQGSALYTSRAGALGTARLCERVGLRRCLLAISDGDAQLVFDCVDQGVTARSFARDLRRVATGSPRVALYSQFGGYPWLCRVGRWS